MSLVRWVLEGICWGLETGLEFIDRRRGRQVPPRSIAGQRVSMCRVDGYLTLVPCSRGAACKVGCRDVTPYLDREKTETTNRLITAILNAPCLTVEENMGEPCVDRHAYCIARALEFAGYRTTVDIDSVRQRILERGIDG